VRPCSLHHWPAGAWTAGKSECNGAAGGGVGDCSSRVSVSPLRCLACLQSSADGASAVMHLAAVVAGQPYARALGAMVARHPSGGTVLKLVAGGARTLRPCPVRKRRRRGRRRCRRDARGRANEDKVPHRSELEGNGKEIEMKKLYTPSVPKRMSF
jgi:hypothetical protein